MTYYAVDLFPVEQKEVTPEIVREHAAHLNELNQAGKLILAGRFLEDANGLVVLKCDDHDEAARIFSVDPLVTGGVRTYRVRTWVLSTAESGFLL